MKQRTLLFILVLLSTLTASAYDAVIEGIFYNLDVSTMKAIVTFGDTEYSGSVTIPETVKYNNATYSVTSIGENAFQYDYNLTSVTIPNSVTSIEVGAFYCTVLTNVYCYAESIPTTADNAFIASPISLAVLHVPAVSVEMYKATYPWNMFNVIVAIADVEIDGVFYNLDTTTMEATVTSGVPQYTGSVTIPKTVIYKDVSYSVTSIAYGAFYECSGLTSVTIGSSVTSIANGAFYECSGLTSISVEKGNTVYDSRDNCNALINTATNTLIVGCKNTVIPNDVTSIGENAFRNCIGLTEITIPNSVTSIGDEAFYFCDGLKSLTIGNSVTSIGDGAFCNCSELIDVYCYAESVPTAFGAFGLPSYAITLHVPAVSIEMYKATYPWNVFTIVAIDPSEVKTQKTIQPNAEPDSKYMKNGKLIIIKEGKKYDAAGKLSAF